MCAAKKGEYDKAIADYSQAKRPGLEARDIYQTLAEIYFDKSDFKRAVFELEEVLELCPNNEDVMKKLEEARNALREEVSRKNDSGQERNKV